MVKEYIRELQYVPACTHTDEKQTDICMKHVEEKGKGKAERAEDTVGQEDES